MKISEDFLTFFAKWIEDNVGMIYDDTNLFQLERRVQTYLKDQELSLESFEQNIPNLRGSDKQEIVDLVVNNETYFFREKKFFDSLKDEVLPYLKNNSKHIKIASLACSLGQEVYSIAMTIEKFDSRLMYQIDGFDISTKAIAKGSSGLYNDLEIKRGLDDEHLKNYFTRKTGEYEVIHKIKSSCSFTVLNLKDNWNILSEYDLVCCRNVLYYLDRQTKEDILAKAHKALKPHGVFGSSVAESISRYTKEFESFNNLPGFYLKAASK